MAETKAKKSGVPEVSVDTLGEVKGEASDTGAPGTPAGVLGKRKGGVTDELAAVSSGQGGSGAHPDVERVELMIPRDPSNPQDGDVSIIVNGEIFQIKRGVKVMVPRYVQQAYMDSEAQKAVAYDRAQRAVNRD